MQEKNLKALQHEEPHMPVQQSWALLMQITRAKERGTNITGESWGPQDITITQGEKIELDLVKKKKW